MEKTFEYLKEKTWSLLEYEEKEVVEKYNTNSYNFEYGCLRTQELIDIALEKVFKEDLDAAYDYLKSLDIKKFNYTALKQYNCKTIPEIASAYCAFRIIKECNVFNDRPADCLYLSEEDVEQEDWEEAIQLVKKLDKAETLKEREKIIYNLEDCLLLALDKKVSPFWYSLSFGNVKYLKGQKKFRLEKITWKDRH